MLRSIRIAVVVAVLGGGVAMAQYVKHVGSGGSGPTGIHIGTDISIGSTELG